MSESAESLLAAAKEAYQKGRENYRDALLAAGRLLREYVRVCIEVVNTDAHPRGTAIHQAAQALQVCPARIRILIGSAAVVELLGDGKCGVLGLSSIHLFKCFICRQKRQRTRVGGTRKRFLRREVWTVRKQYRDVAKPLYQKAVLEGWTTQKIRETIKQVVLKPCAGALINSPSSETSQEPNIPRRVGRPCKRVHQGNASTGRPVLGESLSLAEMAQAGTPADVADMCLDLVKACQDPQKAAERLLPALQRLKNEKPKKARISLGGKP